jgi:TusA-related sulfurtransferase
MIDTRGLSCPIPVVMVQKAVKDAPASLEVLADAQVAVENITRFASSQGYQVSVTEDGEDFKLILTK